MNTNFNFKNGLKITKDRPLLIAGPCVIEGEKTIDYAEKIFGVIKDFPFQWVFKASFDKANRTSATSLRGIGIDEGLNILEKIKGKLGVHILTDVHLPEQCESVAQVADILQIPSFLCRQTDLILSAAETGKMINLKKGQFLSPKDMHYAVKKAQEFDNRQTLITERGTTFGYNNLIVDFTSLPTLQQSKVPVILDATHSVQQPGSGKGTTNGNWTLAPLLLKAGAAAGYDGFFIETHPKPLESPSDGANMIPLENLKESLKPICRIRTALSS